VAACEYPGLSRASIMSDPAVLLLTRIEIIALSELCQSTSTSEFLLMLGGLSEEEDESITIVAWVHSGAYRPKS